MTTQTSTRVVPAVVRAASVALALGLVCGCGSLDDGGPGTGTHGGGAGGAAGPSGPSTTGSPTGAAGTSQGAGGGAAGTSQPPGSGGSTCNFACPDDSGISVGSDGPIVPPPPPPQGDAASDAAKGPSDGGATGSCSPDMRLCDDFETYTEGMVPAGRWQTLKPPSAGSSLVVDSTKAYSGTKSMHVKATFTGGGNVDIATKMGDPAFANLTNNTMFARLMLYQGTLTVAGELHARLFRLGNMMAPSGSNSTGYAFSLHSYPTPVALQFESMNDVYVNTRVPPVLNQWVCWEFQYGPGMVGWWKDGVAVASPVPGGWPNVPLQMLEVGFDTFTAVTTEFWIDDVAVDTKRVGCPAPK